MSDTILPAPINKLAAVYEQAWGLPPLSIIDFLEELAEIGWTFIDQDHMSIRRADYERAFQPCEHIERPDDGFNHACLVCLSNAFFA